MQRSTNILLLLISVAASLNAPYYGKKLPQENDNAWISSQYDVRGSVFVANKNTLIINGFTYNGNAPDAFFYLGKNPYSEVKEAGSDETAVIIPNERGSSDSLGVYSDQNIVLKLPQQMEITDYKYISVWSKASNAYLGGVDIPDSLVPPAPQDIGIFSQLAHDLRSGVVTVVDSRTFFIRNLYYDGQGPDAFFYIGNEREVTEQNNRPYGKIPDENGSLDKLSAYNGQDIYIQLPESVTVFDIKWLSMWCIRATQDFGNVRIPANLNVPPYMEVSISSDNMNCEPMSDELQVSWIIKNDTITFKLAGTIESEEYMAFGLSGDLAGRKMVGADVVVADRALMYARAIDYYLSAYSQCDSNGRGACPDARSEGHDDVMTSTFEVVDGITVITYSRALTTNDTAHDQDYKTDGTMQQVVWGIGPINTNKEAARHTRWISEAKTINFNRQPMENNCRAFAVGGKVEKPDFITHNLSGKDTKTFTFEIGQAGADQGYKALTGYPSWGIAWYVNGILVPELYLKRGETYTFRVAGGRDPSKPAQYHPLYITSSPVGGADNNKEGRNETIYQVMSGGSLANITVGDYCEYKLKSSAITAARDGTVIYQCFEEFKADQSLKCPENPTYGELTWTPDDSIPDTVYYQCFTHANLGWKIHVSNDYVDVATNEGMGCDSSAHQVIAGFVMTMMFMVLIYFF